MFAACRTPGSLPCMTFLLNTMTPTKKYIQNIDKNTHLKEVFILLTLLV